MIALDLYKQLIANLEIAKVSCNPPPPKIKTSLHSIGSFLRSRSSEFEILENQEDISVFLSVCKSSKGNLLLVFNYFLSDSLVMPNKKESSSKFLKAMLSDFDNAVKGLYVTGNQTRQPSEYKVISGRKFFERIAPVKNNLTYYSLYEYNQS